MNGWVTGGCVRNSGLEVGGGTATGVSERDAVGRAADWVCARTFEPVVHRLGKIVERRVRGVGEQLPEPSARIGAVAAVVVGALSLSAAVIERRRSRTASERAEPSPTAERCSDPSEPSAGDGPPDEIVELAEALDALDVEYPPVPSESEAEAAYRERVLEAHPDAGGDAEEFIEVRQAWRRIEGGELSNREADGDVTGR